MADMEECVVKQELEFEQTVLQKADIYYTMRETIKIEPAWEGQPSEQGFVKSEPYEPNAVRLDEPGPVNKESVKLEHNNLDPMRPVEDSHVLVEELPAVPCEGCGQSLQNRSELLQHDSSCIISRDVKDKAAHYVIPIPDISHCDTQGIIPHQYSQCEYNTSCESVLFKKDVTENKPYKCTQCDFKTSFKINITRHLRIHTGDKPFKCSQCEYSASVKDTLTRHIRTHTGERPFKCPQCNYSASLKGSLVEHIRTHTGDKPFKCTQCEYRASKKSDLTKHLRVHTGEKPFKCTQCEYRVSDKSTLVAHLRIHTGYKPFKCTKCEYTASTKSHLNTHLKMHTGDRSFKCSHCEYSASKKFVLAKHIRIHTEKKNKNIK